MKTRAFTEFCRSLQFDLTGAQRALAAVSFDGAPVPPEFADLFGGHVGAVPLEARRTIAWVCGRGSGKTRLCAAYALWRALYADLSALAKGELGFVVIVAPDRELATQTIRFVRGQIEGTPLAKLIHSEDASSITLRRLDGRSVRVQVFAASRGGSAIRGKSIIAAVLDEACFFRAEGSGVVNDSDIYRSITPRLMKGGSILCVSTPWLQSGLLHDLWSSQFGAAATALVALAPTERMRDGDPTFDPAIIAAERARDPGNAAREFDCQWLPVGSGSAFDPDSLAASLVDDPPELPQGDTAIGGDLGFVSDPSAFVAAQKQADGSIVIVDVLELRPRKGLALSITNVLQRAADFSAKHAQRRIRVDHHSLPQARDIIEREGLPIELDAASESATEREGRFTAAVQAFRAGRVRIPKRFAAVTDQLARIVATPRETGGYAFSAGRRDGNHSDAAMALILAIDQMLEVERGIENLRRFVSPENMAGHNAYLDRVAEERAVYVNAPPNRALPGLRAAMKEFASAAGRAASKRKLPDFFL